MFCGVVFVSYDTWMTDTDIDADVEPPLEPEGPWQVQVFYCNNLLYFCHSKFFSRHLHIH